MKVEVLPRLERGRNEEIRLGSAESPFGRMWLAEAAAGLCRIGFGESVEAQIAREWPQAAMRRDDAWAAGLAEAVLDGGRDLVVAVKGTPFQLSVWRELRRIPRGRTISYGELAARIGHPTASRAVGAAVGANRIAWLIPCHRVVRADGGLGGFRWGGDCKRAMLEWERTRSGFAQKGTSPDMDTGTAKSPRSPSKQI